MWRDRGGLNRRQWKPRHHKTAEAIHGGLLFDIRVLCRTGAILKFPAVRSVDSPKHGPTPP
jgi:hypothetical protein